MIDFLLTLIAGVTVVVAILIAAFSVGFILAWLWLEWAEGRR